MEALKVTDPAKIVTDPVLLAHLERQGIDKDYVELTSDYGKAIKGKSSPYAKFYRDLKSDKQFMVVAQLPMVDNEGKAIEAGWQKTDKGFAERNNLFKADVSGIQVTLAVRNDQPDGRKAKESVTFSPQIFLDNIEITCLSGPTLIAVDPVNSNYSNNVLEWDYGICKRRLRLIEGHILGSWVFNQNPNEEVRIKYNQSGDFKLKLGQYAVSDDEELITKEQFNKVIYPLTVSDSATFYPDAHTETSSVDGMAQRYTASGESWSNMRTGAGATAWDSITYAYVLICSHANTSNWVSLARAIVLFNTSGLPDDCSITAAIVSIYGSLKADALNITPNINLYASTPASNTAIVAADYSQVGSTALSTLITYASFSVTGYNDFALNDLTIISKTSITKLGFRNANYDVSGTTPTWSSNVISELDFYTAEQGTGYKPKLVITYTMGEVKTSSDSGNGTEATSLRELGTAEAGSGVEASLTAAIMLASDGGSGSEMGGLLKSLFSQDEGGGTDNVKILTGKAGYDLRLHNHRGQVSITHKEVNL
jgi:hypothetical protein